MTAQQLHGLAGKHGYRIVVRPEGPSRVRARSGAELPNEVLWLFKRHRTVFLPRGNRLDDPTPRQAEETCRVCKALVVTEFAPCWNPEMTAETFGCNRGQTRDTPGCPYVPIGFIAAEF